MFMAIAKHAKLRLTSISCRSSAFLEIDVQGDFIHKQYPNAASSLLVTSEELNSALRGRKRKTISTRLSNASSREME